MSLPKLFMHVQDPLLASNLLSIQSVRQYELNISHQDKNWLDQLTAAQCDVALIEVNSLHDTALKELINSPILYQTEFLFFSQGGPDPILDKLMHKGAGFHYRAPFNLKLIESSLEEIFCELNLTKELISTQTSYLDQFGLLVGSSSAMHSLYRTIRKVASWEKVVQVKS